MSNNAFESIEFSPKKKSGYGIDQHSNDSRDDSTEFYEESMKQEMTTHKLENDRQSVACPTVEYEYVIRVGALDSFKDLLKEEKIPVPAGFGLLSFKSSRLLNMKKYFDRGLLSSYAILKTVREDEWLEEEFQEKSSSHESLPSEKMP